MSKKNEYRFNLRFDETDTVVAGKKPYILLKQYWPIGQSKINQLNR